MKPSSAKAKGRTLQKLVVSFILRLFPSLTKRDVVSTSMGATGADIKLSENAFKIFPFAIECKNLSKFSVYQHYEQAKSHSKKEGGIPLLVIKQNRSEPLAILSLADFLHYVNKSKND